MVISDTRYQLSLFAMFDYESVEKRLEKMAAKGWEIENTGIFFWKYRRTTPQKKNYAVVFSKDASEYNPCPTDGQHLLRKLCNYDGWEKEAEWKQMEIFSTDNVEKNLETDEMVRLSSIRRAMKKTSYHAGRWLWLACSCLHCRIWPGYTPATHKTNMEHFGLLS